MGLTIDHIFRVQAIVATRFQSRFESARESYAGYVKAGVLPALVAELKG